MIVDDYANCDTPGVTRAVNEFIRCHKANIKRVGYRTIEFQNKGKEVPIVLSFVYFEPVDDIEKVRSGVDGRTASIAEAKGIKKLPVRIVQRVMRMLLG